MAIMGGAVARESLTLRAWSTTCVYVVIYGAAFAFLVGPATHQLGVMGDPAAQRTVVFAMWLVTATVLTVGALLLSYTIDLALDRRFQRHLAPTWRVEMAFATRGMLFAVLAAGLFVGIGALAVGGVTMPLIYAALLAFIVPGFLAGASTHNVVPTVLAERKQVVVVSGFALLVVGLSNYALIGAANPLTSLAL